MRDVPKAQVPSLKQYRGRLASKMLLIFLPLTILPVLIAGVIGLSRLYILLRDQTTNRISSDAISTSLTIDARINSGEAFLEQLTEDSRFWPIVESAINLGHGDAYFPAIRGNIVREFLEISNLQTEPPFDQFMIVLPNGTILVSSEPNWEGANLVGSDLKPLLYEQKTEGLIINTPVFANGYRVYTSLPVVRNNAHLATIIGIGNQSILLRDLANIGMAVPGVRSYFVTSNGDLLTLNSEHTELVNIDPGEGLYEHLQATFKETTELKISEYTSLAEVDVLGMTLWNKSINAGVVNELPKTVMISNMMQLLPFIAGLLAFLMLTVGVVVSIVTRRLVQPIGELSNNAQRFAEGDWSRRAIIQRDDELGMLGDSFNQMADELESQYRTLQWKIEERSKQIRMASEVAQAATSAPHLKELLRRTVNLVTERFGFYDASIFLIDETGVYAVLAEASEKVEHSRKEGTFRLAVGSRSLIGWAAANNQPRISNDAVNDPLFLPDDLLPDTKSEAVVPVSAGDTVIGVLDVQSNKLNAFSQEDITILQTITNLVATAIRNIRLLEGTQINLEEASLLYNASSQIGKAQDPAEVYQVAARAMRQSSFLNALLVAEGNHMKIFRPALGEEVTAEAKHLDVSYLELEVLIPGSDRYLIVDPNDAPNMPEALHELLTEWMVDTVALIPIRAHNRIDALIVVASREAGTITATAIQPYTNLGEMISTSIDKLNAQLSFERQLNELQTISDVSRSVSAQTDFRTLIESVHQGIRQSIGDVNFLMAMYDADNKTISVPYMADGETVSQVDSFPLGEGLTSIVIRNREPLLLKSIDETELDRLGAKIVGSPARSWLGVPLIFGNDVIGVMAIQDLKQANRFNEEHVRLMTTLATQIAVSIRNTRLLELARLTAERERTAHEMSSKIRGSVEVRKILETTASELGKALGARRARVEIDFGETAPVSSDEQKEVVK